MITYNLNTSKLFPSKLKNKITKKIKKIDNAYLRTSGNAQFKEKVIEFLDDQKEREIDGSHMTSEEIESMFKNHIVDSDKATAEKETKHHPDWFSQSEHLLSFHIELRNQCFKLSSNNPLEQNRKHIREARELLQTEKRRA